MIELFKIKYPLTNPLIPLKAITYFDEIDPNIDPPKLKKKLPLEKIKKRILKAVLHPSMTFDVKQN
jgi:predicted nucleic acid-binding protein